ncbi:MAG: CBS domain-containing protein [Bacilli bacterium]|jgi:predicted transcriptional regulator|nr:CBS domain-containing protein [Bacilli bacterium]
MDDQETIDTFLTAFKQLEKELLSEAELKDDYVSFSRALNHLYYNRLNPVIANRDNYEFLKTASDVRNLLSHEVTSVVPTQAFLAQFQKIAQAILNPLTCYEVATKTISSCSYGDSLYKVLALMDEKSLSHLPILDSTGQVVGVFSRDVFFDYLLLNKTVTISDDLQVSDFREVLPLDSHLNESYLFVSRYTSLHDAYQLMVKKNAHDKTVGLLLVTEHGKKDERLLGVITLTDLARLGAQA